jgi:hypothetical protein
MVTLGPYLIQAMTNVVEGSTMVVPQTKPRFKQWATIVSSEGRLRLYRNPYSEDDMVTRREH